MWNQRSDAGIQLILTMEMPSWTSEEKTYSMSTWLCYFKQHLFVVVLVHQRSILDFKGRKNSFFNSRCLLNITWGHGFYQSLLPCFWRHSNKILSSVTMGLFPLTPSFGACVSTPKPNQSLIFIHSSSYKFKKAYLITLGQNSDTSLFMDTHALTCMSSRPS